MSDPAKHMHLNYKVVKSESGACQGHAFVLIEVRDRAAVARVQPTDLGQKSRKFSFNTLARAHRKIRARVAVARGQPAVMDQKSRRLSFDVLLEE